MAALIDCLGVILFTFFAFRNAEAISCYRCIYMEVEGGEHPPSHDVAETNGTSGSPPKHAPVPHGSPDCVEQGGEFRRDYSTQDECTGELELVPVASFKPLHNIVSWNDLYRSINAEAVDLTPEQFACQKAKFTMTSEDSDIKVNVWYRGCSIHKVRHGCPNLETLAESRIFKEVYADLAMVKSERVNFDGKACTKTCENDSCNSAVITQISLLLVALCSLVTRLH